MRASHNRPTASRIVSDANPWALNAPVPRPSSFVLRLAQRSFVRIGTRCPGRPANSELQSTHDLAGAARPGAGAWAERPAAWPSGPSVPADWLDPGRGPAGGPRGRA